MIRLKEIAKKYTPPQVLRLYQKWRQILWTAYGKIIKNYINLRRNAKKHYRCLEIGSGSSRMEGFETLDIVGGPNIDYVYDAAKKLPFKDNTFDLIYASHVLEHFPWYKVNEILCEWVRTLKKGGVLEIWVPDGLKICRALVQAEVDGVPIDDINNWCPFNPHKDPCVWASARIFWGANDKYPSWHKSLYTAKYLKELLTRVGLINIHIMKNQEVRGYDHGWINLGIRGIKP